MTNREFDIVVFGATSFVGQILCDYLVNEHTEPNLSWAMAARSKSKLEALQQRLGPRAEAVPVFVADSFDEASLGQLCQKASVVISTVGPYALYGETLVRTCAESGTDYCDLTGESFWIRAMIDKYEASARLSGARIVNCCGFDSIPSDLGVRFLQEQALQAFGETCERVDMGVKVMKGGASGGTIASGINMYKQAAGDPELRRQMADPYSLCPQQHGFETEQREEAVAYREAFQSWAGPFIMAAINTRIVLRSVALMGMPYGNRFQYSESTLTGDGDKGRKRARRLARGMKLGALVMSLALTRWLASRFLPKPGEGPTPEQQRSGAFELLFVGTTASGAQIQTRVTGDRDPGYGGTAKMLAQAAISLRRDVDKGAKAGGFWTPASVFGAGLYERLTRFAGLRFEVISTQAATPVAALPDQSADQDTD